MDKKIKKRNSTISLSCIATLLHKESALAIENTLKCLNVSKIYWFSDIAFPKKTDCEVLNIKISPFDTKKSFHEAYSYLTLKVMPEVVDTDYNLIVQYDGYAVNKKAWTDRFLDYDYIGAVMTWHPLKKRVGNGGFCLRSKKLYRAMKAIDLRYTLADLIKYKNFDKLFDVNLFIDKFSGLGVPEDIILTQVYRKELEEKYEIKFAGEKIANRFSIENNLSSSWALKSFGFHGGRMLNYYNSVFPLVFKK